MPESFVTMGTKIFFSADDGTNGKELWVINTVAAAPSANFSASATTIPGGSTIYFTDLSTNSPVSWSWTFQGGTPSTSTAQNPAIVTFAAAGSYEITLTATNASGSDSEPKSCYINVQPSGVDEVSINTVAIYTNPGTGIFSVRSSAPVKAHSVSIHDMVGNEVSFASSVYSDGVLLLDITSASAGIYFIKITEGDNSVMRKVVLSK